MRLATVKSATGPRAALVQGHDYIDLQATDPALPSSVRTLLQQGPTALAQAAKVGQSARAVRLPAPVQLMSPLPDPQKYVCLGLNYRDHALESGSPIPKEPILFAKYPTALIGHQENIELPSVSQEVDYEAELVIVVGKRGRHIAADQALSYVAGYSVGHDVSARDWQLKKDGKQWMVGKTFDTFAPVGPHLVTSDEVPDPHKLGIRLRLNGQTMQDSCTAQMIFSVAETIVYLSTVFTLEPGDLIFTGTPPGVGFAKKPPLFLKPGDVVDVEIDGLGVLSNRVIQGK